MLVQQALQVAIIAFLTFLHLTLFYLASWLITFLGCHPEWQKKAVAEIETLLASHPFPSNEKPSLSAHLATIPISAWESQTPILDGFIRETLRLAQPHIAMRKNVGPDVYIGDKVVPSGTFLIYPFSDIHLNPSVYEDPWTFNPGRAERKDNDSEGEGAYEFVGWGAGKSFLSHFYFYSNAIFATR